MREEVIGETLDSMLDDDTEEEENRIISQVLDEIGIDMSAKACYCYFVLLSPSLLGVLNFNLYQS